MQIELKDETFGSLINYVKDENVTDIKWNGSTLWINDLNKGRYVVKNEDGSYFKLDRDFLKIFTSTLANMVNDNFNRSKPSLKAETKDLRIQAEHESVTGDETYSLAIRKTPSVSRLAQQDLVANGYASKIVYELLPCLMRARLSGVVTGDVGAGKTELTKYLCKFIPELDGIVTVEDTLEMRLKEIFPEKDIISMRITDEFTADSAIRDALRLLVKWLIIAEARGREINRIIEGASTGCVALTSIHAENTWEIPDRIMNMAGEDSREGLENDVYSFFDFAIKIKAEITHQGIKRSIDQISFFDREDGINQIIVFYKDGKMTGQRLPRRVEEKFMFNNEDAFLKLYKPAIEELEGRNKETED